MNNLPNQHPLFAPVRLWCCRVGDAHELRAIAAALLLFLPLSAWGQTDLSDFFADRTDFPAVGHDETIITSWPGSREPDEPAHAGLIGIASYWWRWTPQASGDYLFLARSYLDDQSGSIPLAVPGEPGVAIYTGDALTNLVEVASALGGWVTNSWSSSAYLRFAAEAGREYAIVFEEHNPGCNPDHYAQEYRLWMRLDAVPANDDFASAEDLPADGVVTGTTAGASAETDEPLVAGIRGASRWWKWIAPSNAVMGFDAMSSAALGIFTGGTIKKLTTVVEVQVPGLLYYIYPPAVQTNLCFVVTGGQTYFLAASGWVSYPNTFDVALRTIGALPANDNFAQAADFPAEGVVEGTTAGASAEPGEPAVAGWTGASVWWKWTAPTSAGMSLDAQHTAALGVFTGDSLGNLVALAQVAGRFDSTDPPPQSTNLLFAATAGQTYYLAASGQTNHARTFNLTLRAVLPAVPYLRLEPRIVVTPGAAARLQVRAFQNGDFELRGGYNLRNWAIITNLSGLRDGTVIHEEEIVRGGRRFFRGQAP